MAAAVLVALSGYHTCVCVCVIQCVYLVHTFLLMQAPQSSINEKMGRGNTLIITLLPLYYQTTFVTPLLPPLFHHPVNTI
jgi:hypothetical protein